MKKKYKLSEMFSLILDACLLTVVVSCGDYARDRGSIPQEEEAQEGVFNADLNPENENLSSAAGNATITVRGDNFNSIVALNNAFGTGHAQHIHSGTRCPTPADDTNNDGVVDSVEAAAVYGPVIVPLDDDLSSDGGSFPSGARYVYNESASLSEMLGNLNIPSLSAEGLVINIHGIPESVTLPVTAQGSKADFPISCGVLRRVVAEEATGGTN